jgi:lysozyme family protein
MEANRQAWMDLLFSDDVEGGWSDRPKSADPGGKTMRGITLGCYSDFLGREATADELRQISEETAREIAITMFWNPVSGDSLPGGVDILAADFAFHSHWTRAAKELQKLVGVKVDGFVGPNTISAARKQDQQELVTRYCDARMDFLEGLSNWEPNARGWRKRVTLMRDLARKKIQARPTLTAALTNPEVVGTATAAAAGATGIGWYLDQLGPLFETVKGLIDPAYLQKLQSVDATVAASSAGDPLPALALMAYMTATSAFAVWRIVQTFRKGRVIA